MTDMFAALDIIYFSMELTYDENGKPVDGIFCEVNPSTERLLGKSRVQLIGKSREELFGSIFDELPRKFDEVVKNGKPCHFEGFGGALQKYYDIYAWKIGKNRVSVILRDISKTKKAEEEVARIASFPVLNPNPIIEVDFNSHISYANPSIKNLFPNLERLGLSHPFLCDWQNIIKAFEEKTSDTFNREIKVGEQWYYQTLSLVPKTKLIRIYAIDITNRKKAEEALKTTLDRFYMSLSSMYGAILLVSENNEVEFANQSFCDYFGFSESPSQLKGWSADKIITRVVKVYENPEVAVSRISEIVAAGKPVRGEEVRLKGNKVCLRDFAPLQKNDTSYSRLWHHIDITELKKAQEALRKSAELARERAEELEKLMDIIPAAVWVSRDPQCENITGNQAANKFYEASGGENVSAGPAEGGAQNPTRRFFKGNRELTPQELPMQEAAAKNVEIRNSELDVLLPSNRKITILGNAKPLLDNKGEVRGCLAVFMDVTERKQAEDALKENEQLYHTVFDNSQDGFQLIELIYDKNGKPIDHKFLKVNHAYELIIGVKADDILGKTARHISPNVEPYWFDVPDRVTKTGISEHVELYNKDIDKWLDCFYFLYSKNVVGTLFRDITERKKLEKQLQDSERLAAIGATAGMVGHDIRNPLQAITGDVFLAKTELASTSDSDEKNNALESLKEIEKNVDYINKIVADLQDYARPLNPCAQETSVKSVFNEVLAKSGVPKNIKVTVEVEDEADKVMADPDYLKRIATNLTLNAVQAMPDGGKLVIRVFVDKKTNDVLITVKDTGVGIPEIIKSKLFTPMMTTKAKGQGFGLAVVKRMAEGLGGTVSFESLEGKGTTFIVRLPPPKR